MISPELSTIQRNKERSALLEAEVAEFLKRGGVIETKQGFPLTPEPKRYGRMSTPAAPQLHTVGPGKQSKTLCRFYLLLTSVSVCSRSRQRLRKS